MYYLHPICETSNIETLYIFFAAVSHELFEDKKNKTRETFKNAIEIFNGRDHRRRGAVEFIQAALKNMKQFGVHKYDLNFPF